MIYSVFTNPIYEGLIMGLGSELSRPRRRMDLDDESVGSFLNRRFEGSKIADNVASAVLHGIYAGDIYKLSIKSLLPSLWYIEGLYNTLVGGSAALVMGRKFLISHQDMQLSSTLGIKLDRHLLYKMRNASVYTFKAGISTLSAMLEDRLKANPNVEFKLNSKVSSIEHDVQSDQLTVCLLHSTLCSATHTNNYKIKTSPELPASTYTRAISTIPGRTLPILTTTPLPSLASIHSVTVMVVNLFFSQSNLLPQRGFGYLIPRSIPFPQNPERALGVIFDSDATPAQDSIPGTKVTVMLGGHWWDDFESYPSGEEGVEMARRVLKRHLSVDAEPILSKATLQRDCIPQYTVGHEARMKRAHGELMNAFGGKLAVAGNSYTGVGVNDCVRAARDVVMEVKRGEDVTGLEGFTSPRAWAMVSRDVPR
jgi:oxygen-dependent protoporphyrinogen oxidase